MAIERSGQGHGVGASVPPRRTTGTCAAAVSSSLTFRCAVPTRSYFCAAPTRTPLYAQFLCHPPLEAGSSPPPTCHGSSRSGW
jgi:hypothetical protein